MLVLPGFLFLLLLTACEEKIAPSVLSDLRSTALPSQESWNSTITFSDSGIVKAILKAGHLASYESSKMTFLDQGVHVDFFDERGRHSSVLTSESGTVDENTDNLVATGNVVITSDSGVVVRTEKLTWDNNRQLIVSDEFVRVTTPKETLQGRGFEADQNLRNYKIFRVSGTAEAR